MPKILLVADNELVRNIMSRWLTRWGYTVTTANNGEEAINRVQSDKPSLVLMDLDKSKIDGWEAARRLKAVDETSQIPIIVVSEYSSEEDSENAWMPHDGYCARPVDYKRLQGMIKAILRHIPPSIG